MSTKPHCTCGIYIDFGHCLCIKCQKEAQARIKEFEGLVREMGNLFLSVVKMTCKSNQYAELFYDIDDRIYAVLNRPLVKELMEKKDELAANERLAELASEDMVLVLRDDLQLMKSWFAGGTEEMWAAMDRITAAMEKAS